MKKIIMLAGIGGTGKSYYAKNLNLPGLVKIVSSDEIRYSITKSYSIILDNMMIVYDKMIETCNELIKENEDITVILDSTFLNDQRRNYFIDHLKNYDELELHMLKVHDEKIIYERNKKRMKEKWIPEDVIASMIKKYSYPSKENISKYTLIKEVYVDEK